MPDPTIVATCLLIFLARIADVSLGTLRIISVVQGRAFTAWLLGFLEVLIWLVTVSHVVHHLDYPIYALFYALGYASGNYIGVRFEAYLALGEQVVRVFTRTGDCMADALRSLGFRVTSFDGHGRGGPVRLLFIETKRRDVPRILASASSVDPECFYLVDDIRLASYPTMLHPMPTGWRAILKRK